MTQDLQPGQILARGMCRHLRLQGFQCVLEFVPARGLRVDIMAIGPGGEIWIVECKSSRADYMSDSKWDGYLEWCDRFFWCVGPEFPVELLPQETGLMFADGYDGEIQHLGPESKLTAARRKKLTLAVARTAMQRLAQFTDPRPGANFLGIETDRAQGAE